MKNAIKHSLSLKDFETDQLVAIIRAAKRIKQYPKLFSEALSGKTVATLYEKPSLRTRVTFEVGINKLGGRCVLLDLSDGGLGKRESVKDLSQNLSLWVDAIVARVHSHKTLDEFKVFSKVPIINSLSDWYHPCQALADILTLEEQYSDLEKVTLAYLGDGNNVAHSLLNASALYGFNLKVITPKNRQVHPNVLAFAQSIADSKGLRIETSDSLDTLAGVDVVYTDTWISMGDNTCESQARSLFMPYQVNQALMERHGIKFFMHCQPIHRGLEATDDVCDGQHSLILNQSENRLWAQCALLVYTLAPEYLQGAE